MPCAPVREPVFENQMIFKHFTAQESPPKKLVIQVVEIAGFGRVFQTGGFRQGNRETDILARR
jgi:hypothetical protein